MKREYRKPDLISDDMFEQTANQTGPNSDPQCEIPNLVVRSCERFIGDDDDDFVNFNNCNGEVAPGFSLEC